MLPGLIRCGRRRSDGAGRSGLEPEIQVRGDFGDVHLGLLQMARVVPVHRLPAGELVKDPDAGLAAAVAGLAVPAEWQVRLGARCGVVHAEHPGAYPAPEAEY